MLRMQPEDDGRMRDGQIEVCATAHTNAAIRRLVKSVTRGLRACQEPEKTAEGMGGTYFFCNENGRKVPVVNLYPSPCNALSTSIDNPMALQSFPGGHFEAMRRRTPGTQQPQGLRGALFGRSRLEANGARRGGRHARGGCLLVGQVSVSFTATRRRFLSRGLRR
jgi:hypothetical protein